jgi:hypothetical protein
MRNFFNVKNQRLYLRHAHQLYAQNAPDCVCAQKFVDRNDGLQTSELSLRSQQQTLCALSDRCTKSSMAKSVRLLHLRDDRQQKELS